MLLLTNLKIICSGHILRKEPSKIQTTPDSFIPDEFLNHNQMFSVTNSDDFVFI